MALSDPSVTVYPFPEYPTILCLFEGAGEGPSGSAKHSHPWAQMNIVLEGEAVWHTEDGPTEVAVGDGFLLMPGAPHHAEIGAGVFCRTGTLDFVLVEEQESPSGPDIPLRRSAPPRSGAIRWLLDALSRRPYHRLTWDGFPEWWRRLCAQQEAAGGPCRALRVEGAMLEVLGGFADPALARGGERESGRQLGIERALRHASDRLLYGAPPTVAELAKIAGMSRARFTERFHKTVGTPPHAYVAALRIWTAQSSLAGTAETATQIARRLGFSSPQHFSRVFKEATGLTPSEYRRRWAAPWLRND